MTDHVRPPPSSRETAQRNENTLTVTHESREMAVLLEQCVKTARHSHVISLIVPQEDSLELASFTRRCLRKIYGDLKLHIISPDDGVPNHTSGECGLLILRPHLMSDKALEQLEADDLDFPIAQITILAFPNKKAYETTRNRFSINYQKRLAGMPLEWPSLKDRKADLGGIISAIWAAVAPEDNTLSREARAWILAKHGDTVDQLYATIRRGVKIAERVNEKVILPDHLDAATRKDKREAIYVTAAATPRKPTPTPMPLPVALGGPSN